MVLKNVLKIRSTINEKIIESLIQLVKSNDIINKNLYEFIKQIK